MKDQQSEQNGAGSLTFKENLIRPHTGLDSLPGYTVVIFKKLPKGGESFFKLVGSGERLKLPLLSLSHQYFAVAVNQSFLSYTFEDAVTMDDGFHMFTLIYHLKYKVAAPRRVAELRQQDPLGKLRQEITFAIKRACAKRSWEMLKNRFRQLEVLLVDGAKVRLQQYAATLGLDIISIELDKRLPPFMLEPEAEREKAALEQELIRIRQELRDVKEQGERRQTHARNVQDVEYEYEVRETVLDKEIGLKDKENAFLREKLNRGIMEEQAGAVRKIYDNIASNIQTPEEGIDAIEAQMHAQKILQAGQASNGGAHSPAELSAPVPGRQLSPFGEEDLTGLMSRALAQIEQLGCTYAQKQALRSGVMHIVAEVQLEDHADKEAVRRHAVKLAELAKTLRLPSPQYSLLKRFWDYEQLPGYHK
jgi:hypothetical protein